MSVGYLPHSFDLFNVAHLDLVAAARSRSTRLVLAVLDDAEVRARTGRAPVVPLAERLEIVAHVTGVDAVVVHGSPEAQASLEVADLLVAPEEVAAWPEGAVALPATRTTTSAVLRHALRPVTTGAVA